VTTPVFNVTGSEAGTIVIRVQMQDSDGVAIDLSSGYTGQIQVRETDLSEDVLAEGTVEFSADGIVTATIAATDTLDWTTGVYDIRVESAGVVEYVCRGTITLIPTVTRE
jgi:hypothetical protein